jgi:hypothetical protein
VARARGGRRGGGNGAGEERGGARPEVGDGRLEVGDEPNRWAPPVGEREREEREGGRRASGPCGPEAGVGRG